jgi:hypothetical protein
MINHARTLLLNKNRDRMHYSDYGYEYVPAAFRPVTLPSTLSTLRQLLFGTNPDNYFLNFRVNELLSYIHATELAEYVYRLDPRVTYWPRVGRPYFEPAGKRVSITQIYGSPRRLNVAGNLYALTAKGKASNLYTVSLRRVTENGETSLQMEVRYQGERDSRFTVTVADLSSPPIVVLPDTELNLRLNPSAYQTEYSALLTEINDFIVVEAYDTASAARLSNERMALAAGQEGLVAQWLVETKVNPAPVITTVMPSMEMLGEPVYLEIFGVEDKEPYLTFKNLWFDHPLPAYRLSGMVLALIYRTEELRGRNV